MSDRPDAPIELPDQAVYNAFISDVELRTIALESCRAEFVRDAFAEGGGTIAVRVDTTFEPATDEELVALVRVQTRAKSSETHRMCTKVDCVYRLVYWSAVPATPEILCVFAKNVEMNVWPYARELTHSLTGKMPGPTLTLPLHKS
ncbi:MAG: hypothetical protein WBI63_09110 [Coriobacteriia bacterium]